MNKDLLLELLIQKFLSRIKEESQVTKDFVKTYDDDITIAIGLGHGKLSYVPYLSFLGPSQTPQHGIYPVLLYYRRFEMLIIAYGVSVKKRSRIRWNLKNVSIKEYVEHEKIKLNYREDDYNESYVYNVYKINKFSVPHEQMMSIIEDVKNIIDEYKGVLDIHKS